MPGLRIENATTIEPVALQTLKTHMKVDIDADDELIKTYLAAGRVKVEGFLSRSLITKSYVQTLDFFPGHHHHDDSRYYRGRVYGLQIKLARSPLIKVSRVEYLDLKGVLQTMLPRVDTAWASATIYTEGNQILDPNGNIQEVAYGEEPGGGDPNQSGETEPTWATGLDQLTNDGEIQWRCKGTAPTGDFLVDTNAEPGRIYPNVNQNSYCWPATQRVPNAVRIHFTAGYGTIPDYVPGHFKTALMVYVKGLYDFRDPLLITPGASPQELPNHLKDLLWEDRIKDFAPTEG